MAEAHAKLSPSAAERWMKCPGSIKASEDIPETTSPYAEEGRLAHEIAHACLVNQTDPLEYESTVMAQGMASHIAAYTDYVNQIKGLHSYEQRVDLSEWIPGSFGTVDALIVNQDTIHVVDLKFGKGVQVFAENNPQLMLYGLGAFAEWDLLQEINRVVLHVVQPRLDHIDTWEISVSDLIAWAEWARERAELALSDDAPRVPGDEQCRFCPAQGTCGALYEQTSRIVGMEFEELVTADVGRMSEEKIRQVLENADLMRGFINAVESHVFNRMLEGQSFNGFKLVEGRSIRRWKDKDEAEKLLTKEIGDLAFEKMLLSPAKAEKLIKKKELLENLIIKPVGKPTMASDADQRPALQDKVFEKFETVN